MASYEGGVWRTIRGVHVFIRDGEDLETAFKRVKQKGYSDNDFRKQEDRIAQLKSEYNIINDKDRVEKINEEAEYHGEKGITQEDKNDIEQELREAREKYGEMSKSPYVERKLKLGRENYDKLMGRENYDKLMGKEDYLKISKDWDEQLQRNPNSEFFKSQRDTWLQKYDEAEAKEQYNRLRDTNYQDYMSGKKDWNEYEKGIKDAKAQYNRIDKEWNDLAKKMEKDYDEFGTTNWKDEKRLNELSFERDKTLANVHSYTDKQIEEGKNPLFKRDDDLVEMAWQHHLQEAKERGMTPKELSDLKTKEGIARDGMLVPTDPYSPKEEAERIVGNKQYSSVIDRYNRDENFRNMLKQEHEKTIETTKKEISSYFDMTEKDRESLVGGQDDLYKAINEDYGNINREEFDRLYNEEAKRRRDNYQSKVFGTDVTKMDKQMKELFGEDFKYDEERRRNSDATEKLVFEREHLLNEKIGSTEGRDNLQDKAQATIERFKERKGKTQDTYTKTGNIRYSSFGIERTPEGDFSDDGTRFTAYRLPNGMEMTVAKANDEIYMSVREPYNKEISYEEYSKLPHYKDLDMYNGVYKNGVDLNKLIDSSNKFKSEYDELLKSKGLKPETRSNKEIRIESIRNQIESNQSSINYYRNSTDYSRWRYNKQQETRLMKKNDRLRKELEKLL